jgi:hypothetical protein
VRLFDLIRSEDRECGDVWLRGMAEKRDAAVCVVDGTDGDRWVGIAVFCAKARELFCKGPHR